MTTNSTNTTTITTTTTDIDSIWNSLKNEDTNDSCSTFSSLDKVETRLTTTKTKESARQQQRLDIIKVVDKPFDIDAACTSLQNVEPTNSNNDEATTTAAKTTQHINIVDSSSSHPTDILCGLNESDNITTSAISCYCDSDDEDELPEQQSSSVNNNSDDTSWRIERVAQALKSGDVSTRVESLIKLNDAINALLKNCPLPPELAYPPPYNNNNDNHVLKLEGQVSSQHSMPRQSLIEEDDGGVDLNNLDKTRARLQVILTTCGNSLIQLIGDKKSEKCRLLSLKVLQSLLLADLSTITRHTIPYLMPALCARYPPCSYDKDQEIFVQDNQRHQFYKRGGATNRQDRAGSTSFQAIEPNEEVRLELTATLKCLLRGIVATNAEQSLDAYYPDIIFSLHSCLQDPFPDVKIEASSLLVQLLRIPRFEQISKYFATGIARSALPNCRHRNTNVIVGAIDLFEASVCVPDKAKRKGAGTTALTDLVGFREENVLPIAAFYNSQCSVSVNTLAELSSHKNHRVRLRCCKMLSYFLVYLPDRYDHQQRLLPYVLSFFNDDKQQVQNEALQCIEKCGLQYENEHQDDVIERRQFGVDGEYDTIDYNHNHLPKPFTRRPSLGARLFVRANSSRFFLAMLDELHNWRDETRKRSAELLLILSVYCEEHLVKDFQHTLTSISKAINFEKSSQDVNDHWKILEKIQQVLCLMGKYIDPAVYLPLICPRICSSDNDMLLAVTSSDLYKDDDDSNRQCSECTRLSYTIILSSLIEGTPLHRLMPHWMHLVTLFSDIACGNGGGTQTSRESLTTLQTLLDKSKSKEVTDDDNNDDNGDDDVKQLFISYFVDAGQMTKLESVLSTTIQMINNTGDGSVKMIAEECVCSLKCLLAVVATQETSTR